MIVLGGLGSVGGAALGAAFVSALPLVFQQYADALPFVGAPGEGGLGRGRRPRASSTALHRPGRPLRARRPRRPGADGSAAPRP